MYIDAYSLLLWGYNLVVIPSTAYTFLFHHRHFNEIIFTYLFYLMYDSNCI